MNLRGCLSVNNINYFWNNILCTFWLNWDFFINLYIEIKYFNNTQDCKLIVYLEGNVTQQLLSIYIDFQIYVKDTIKI